MARNLRTNITMRGWRTLLICLFGLQIAGCGYRLAARDGGGIPQGSTVWCGFIANESTSSTAQTVLRRAVLDEVLRLRGGTAAGEQAAADLTVAGKLKSYGTRAVSYTADDRIREYRLSLEAEFTVVRRGESKPFWVGSLQSYRDFPANDDLALQRNAEEAALRDAARILAEKLVTAVEQGY